MARIQRSVVVPFCLALGLLALASGCTTTRITNLTASAQPRNESGLYPVEVAWSSNQQSIRNETLQASVVIGMNSYPMRPVPLVADRWETVIPVPAGTELIHYRIKFDYEFNSVPVRRPNSKLSQAYPLRINDP